MPMPEWVLTCNKKARPMVRISFGPECIALWILELLPTVISNFCYKQCKAVGPCMMMIWVAGNVTQFISIITLSQPMTSILSTGILCVVDSMLATQSIYYNWCHSDHIHPGPLGLQGNQSAIKLDSTDVHHNSTGNTHHETAGDIKALALSAGAEESSWLVLETTKQICNAVPQRLASVNTLAKIGAWLVNVLYYVSPLKQVYNSCCSWSVSGVSLLLLAVSIPASLALCMQYFCALIIKWHRNNDIDWPSFTKK
eukprot:14456678-Ditylum_brightwellii.AAC.1